MIRINLLPYREKEKRQNLQRQIVLIAGSLVLVVLVLLSGYLFFQFSIRGLEGEIKDAEAKLVILNKKVGDIEGFKKDKKDVEQKLAVIKSLEADRLFPVRMLDELNSLVPTREAWLEKISQAGTELRIEGMAKDNGTVAAFMKKLEEATFVRSVDLIVTKEKEVGGYKLQQFVLSCVIKRG